FWLILLDGMDWIMFISSGEYLNYHVANGNGDPGSPFSLLIVNGFCHFGQNFFAFAFFFLTDASALTYSVANTLKRIFVIVISIMWFGNRVTFLNGLGITLSISGVFLYQKI